MDALLARLQRAIAGRYSVEHELGRGGMATVFLGDDQRLERRVAIKVFEKEGGLISAIPTRSAGVSAWPTWWMVACSGARNDCAST